VDHKRPFLVVLVAVEEQEVTAFAHLVPCSVVDVVMAVLVSV
jgi:hypothetical protein